MKMFVLQTRESGTTSKVSDEAIGWCDKKDRPHLHSLAVGESYKDSDGDTWTRIEDAE